MLPVTDGRSSRPPAASTLPIPRRGAFAGATSLVLTSAMHGGAEEDYADEAYCAAVRLYERQEWTTAFERLAALADGGHAPAARLALLMLRYASLYGQESFEVQPVRIARWAQRVWQAQREAAVHQRPPAFTSRATASPSSMTAMA